MSDTPTDRASGGIPQTWRLRLVWRWIPRMPLALRRRKAFLNALHTLHTMADVQGRTRFQDNGKAIRLPQLAAAMGSREKDARRFLAAAIAAGILTTEEAPRRGRTTVYTLLVPLANGEPRWAAALAVLDAGADADTDDTQHAPAEDEFGPHMPEPAAASGPSSSGYVRPNSSPVGGEAVRATDARPSSGYVRPNGSGYGCPNNPGSTQDQPHEMAAVGPQVRDARGHDETHERAEDSSTAETRSLRAVDGARPAAHTGRPAPPARQMPLLMPVPAPHAPQDARTPPIPGDRPIGAPRDGWRAAVARERPDDAAAVYRDRWTGDHARLLAGTDPTGT